MAGSYRGTNYFLTTGAASQGTPLFVFPARRFLPSCFWRDAIGRRRRKIPLQLWRLTKRWGGSRIGGIRFHRCGPVSIREILKAGPGGGRRCGDQMGGGAAAGAVGEKAGGGGGGKTG